MENIEQRLKKVVAQELGINEADIRRDSSFFTDLGADSLDAVELLMRLEDEFQCDIPDTMTEHITTIQEAIDYINKKLAN